MNSGGDTLADAQGFPYLDMRAVEPGKRLWTGLLFISIVHEYLAHRGLSLRQTIIYRDHSGTPLGLSPWPLTFPLHKETLKRVGATVVKLEDRRFWQHGGLDWLSVARAIYRNLIAFRVVQGASTITQQLVRNVFLYPHRSLARKITEALIAYHIERLFSKDEILEAYCNAVHLGPGVRGFEAALRIYHRLPSQSAAQGHVAATAGCLRAPMRTSPLVSPAAYTKRAAQIEAFLGRETSEAPLLTNPVSFRRLQDARLSRIVDSALSQIYGGPSAIPASIKSIHLTISRPHQRALREALKTAFSDENVESAAGLIIESSTGRVMAECSLKNGASSQFSPAFFGSIQPGSTYKPFVALAALECGISDARIFSSSPFTWESPAFPRGVWSVRNYRHKYFGASSLRDALSRSDNTVFARLIQQLGTDQVVAKLKAFGLLGAKDYYPAAGLGAVTGGVSLSQLCCAYAALATGYLPPQANLIRSIEHADGHFFSPEPQSRILVAGGESLEKLQEILHFSGVVVGGRRIPGKSGTAGKNSTYAAYDDKLSYALWLGFRSSRSEWWEKGAQARSITERLLDVVHGRKFSII